MDEIEDNFINLKVPPLSAGPGIVELFTNDKRLREKVLYGVFYQKIRELHIYRESSREKGKYSCEIYDFMGGIPRRREKLGEKFVKEEGIDGLERNPLIKNFVIADIKLFSYEDVSTAERKIIEEIFTSAKRKVEEMIEK